MDEESHGAKRKKPLNTPNARAECKKTAEKEGKKTHLIIRRMHREDLESKGLAKSSGECKSSRSGTD